MSNLAFANSLLIVLIMVFELNLANWRNPACLIPKEREEEDSHIEHQTRI